MRVVSLLPSATEILFAVGAGDDVVGVTFECDHPPEARSRPVVSNTTLPEGLTPAEIDTLVSEKLAAGEDLYRLDEGALRDANADLVITQDLCAVCAVDLKEVDDALEYLGCRADVLTLDPMSLDDVLTSIEDVGRAVGRSERAIELVASLRVRLTQVLQSVAGRPRPRLAMLEWVDPPFSAGHWVPDLVTAAGAESAMGRSGERSVRITWDDLAAGRPDLVVVAPCGFRLDGAVAQARALVERGVLPPGVPVWAVDADAAFVRPGPRLVDGVEALAGLAHPGHHPARPDLAAQVREGI